MGLQLGARGRTFHLKNLGRFALDVWQGLPRLIGRACKASLAQMLTHSHRLIGSDRSFPQTHEFVRRPSLVATDPLSCNRTGQASVRRVPHLQATLLMPVVPPNGPDTWQQQRRVIFDACLQGLSKCHGGKLRPYWWPSIDLSFRAAACSAKPRSASETPTAGQLVRGECLRKSPC